jgi:hypothetical protein
VPKPNEESKRFEQVCSFKEEVKEVKTGAEAKSVENGTLNPGAIDLVLVGVFDGVGGAKRALELLGIATALYISIENDRDCIGVVSRAWPEVRHLGDLDKVRDQELGICF